jgi:hypothetical protein
MVIFLARLKKIRTDENKIVPLKNGLHIELPKNYVIRSDGVQYILHKTNIPDSYFTKLSSLLNYYKDEIIMNSECKSLEEVLLVLKEMDVYFKQKLGV